MNEEAVDRTNVMLTHHEGSVAAGPAPGPAGRAPAEEFEEEYQKIGWWKGPCATREARSRVREFWSRHGAPGLRWLASRLRQEWHIDALDGVASLLADAGEAAIPPILEELERQPARDQAEALLHALTWIGEQGGTAQPDAATRLEAVLTSFLWHDDPDLRDWAAGSTRLLPREQALGLLHRRLETERDADVRRSIEEVISGDARRQG
jgi:hypothetical protein